jgi:hypothetical protein
MREPDERPIAIDHAAKLGLQIRKRINGATPPRHPIPHHRLDHRHRVDGHRPPFLAPPRRRGEPTPCVIARRRIVVHQLRLEPRPFESEAAYSLLESSTRTKAARAAGAS